VSLGAGLTTTVGSVVTTSSEVKSTNSVTSHHRGKSRPYKLALKGIEPELAEKLFKSVHEIVEKEIKTFAKSRCYK